MNLRAMSFRLLSAFALSAICACSSNGAKQTANDAAAAGEATRMAPVVEKYKKQQILTGFDIKGFTLVVFADTEQYSQLDDSVETAMKSDLLNTWASAWKSGHLGQHATLHVVFKNFYGQEMARLQKHL